MQKILSSKPNSQTLRRSADRKNDHALRPIFLKGATIMDAIIYTTNTGSTGQYAKLLAQETGLPAYSLAEAKKRVFAGAEVVYLGWIMAGSVKGCAGAAKRYQVCAVCGVGMGQTGQTACGKSQKFQPTFRCSPCKETSMLKSYTVFIDS